MFDTPDFLSDQILSDIQADMGDTYTDTLCKYTKCRGTIFFDMQLLKAVKMIDCDF